MALTGEQWKILSEALRGAFTLARFDEFLRFSLDRSREDIAIGGDYQQIVYRVIQSAETEGWTMRLLAAAREMRPDNPGLVETAIALGLSSATVELERKVRDDSPFVDVAIWRSVLGQREFQVCRVEVEAGTHSGVGTGFLIGPSVCLTNYHVVEPLIDKRGNPHDTILRFDYKRGNGLGVALGSEFSLASEDWLVASSPPSPADTNDTAQLPSEDELDYALLRVAGSPGEQPPRLVAGHPEAPRRGWFDVLTAKRIAKDNPLLIMQYPDGRPLKLALGSVLSVNENETRIRHRVNTEAGSSGSPCMNAALDLVAIHHAGDPNYEFGGDATYNQAVPIAAIVKHLKSMGCDAAIAGSDV